MQEEQETLNENRELEGLVAVVTGAARNIGRAIALDLGLSQATADAIRAMDEHWDGGGQPAGLRGHEIPLDRIRGWLDEQVASGLLFADGGTFVALATSAVPIKMFDPPAEEPVA